MPGIAGYDLAQWEGLRKEMEVLRGRHTRASAAGRAMAWLGMILVVGTGTGRNTFVIQFVLWLTGHIVPQLFKLLASGSFQHIPHSGCSRAISFHLHRSLNRLVGARARLYLSLPQAIQFEHKATLQPCNRNVLLVGSNHCYRRQLTTNTTMSEAAPSRSNLDLVNEADG